LALVRRLDAQGILKPGGLEQGVRLTSTLRSFLGNAQGSSHASAVVILPTLIHRR
jgi:hypothetical protein